MAARTDSSRRDAEQAIRAPMAKPPVVSRADGARPSGMSRSGNASVVSVDQPRRFGSCGAALTRRSSVWRAAASGRAAMRRCPDHSAERCRRTRPATHRARSDSSARCRRSWSPPAVVPARQPRPCQRQARRCGRKSPPGPRPGKRRRGTAWPPSTGSAARRSRAHGPDAEISSAVDCQSITAEAAGRAQRPK